VTRVAETGVPDADYEAAAAEFSDKELADLTYAIGLMNAFNRFGVASARRPPRPEPRPRPAGAWAMGHPHGGSISASPACWKSPSPSA
jgi:hypothetical protein